MSVINDSLLPDELDKLETTFRKIRSGLSNAALKQPDLRKVYRDFDRVYQNLFVLTLADLKASQGSYQDLRRDFELGLVNQDSYRQLENQLRKRAEYNYSRFTGEIVQELRIILQDLKISGLPEKEKELIEKTKQETVEFAPQDSSERKSIADVLKPYLDAILTIVNIVTPFLGLGKSS